MKKIKLKLIRPMVLWLINLFGSDIPDVQTGKIIGRALLLPWRGRILVLGTGLDLLPHFCAQTRMTQWQRTLGFTRHPAPDFPHESHP
jgi:hypothetical protein